MSEGGTGMGELTVVLVPGLLCDASAWPHQAEALGRLAPVRIAEHGLRDSLGDMAEAALRLAPGPLAVAGHSMGGRVALEMVRRAPERIAALALLDTGCSALAAGEAGERERTGRLRLLELARSAGMRAMAWEWVQGMVHPQRLQDAALLEGIVAMMARRTPAHFEAQIRALLGRPEACSLLAGIRCPTLVLCGEQDGWSPLEQHRAMAAALSNGTLCAIPECGHMSTLEKPQEVSLALCGWLERAVGGGGADGHGARAMSKEHTR